MEGEVKNLCRVWLSATASLIYCRLVSSRLPEGKWRLISLFPIFYVFAILPMYTASAFITAHNAFFFTWLANFRLLLFAFGRGPLASPALAQSFPIFLAFAALPFTIKPKNDAVAPRKSKTVPLHLPTEIPIAAVLISILYEYRERLHPHIVLLAYCCLIFLAIEIVMGFSILLVRAVLGLELEPASDEPYLSTSLQEFWGRRWNLTVTNLLRPTVYTPVRSATTQVLGRDWAALPAVLVTFLVSGLMHELMFWYVAPTRPPSWEMTMFFVVQGVGVVVEKMALGEKRRLPWWMGGPVSLGFVVGTSFWLFFPPLRRYGSDARTVNELGYAGEVLKGKIVGLFDKGRMK